MIFSTISDHENNIDFFSNAVLFFTQIPSIRFRDFKGILHTCSTSQKRRAKKRRKPCRAQFGQKGGRYR